MAINLTTVDPTAAKFDLTALTSAEIHQLTAVELRKLGGQCGVKGASRGKREELLKALSIIRASQLKVKVEAEEKAKAKAKTETETKAKTKAKTEAKNDDSPVTVQEASTKTGFAIPKPSAEKTTRSAEKGKCEICGIRPQMQPARMQQKHGVNFPYCEPCLEKANWENTHSDEDHANLVSLGSNDPVRQACWICHPELDKTRKTYKPRTSTGISRQGQIVHAKGNKAEVVRAAAAAIGYAVKIKANDGQTTLTATSELHSLQLVWDDRGRYVYPASKWETSDGDGNTVSRRVRNVAEALRLIEI